MNNNLPQYGTPMIGRGREVAEIVQSIAESRLVTVVGVGGIGKTRTAVEVATALDDLGDDVWFADLSSLDNPALVSATVATALGLEVGESGDPASELVAELAPRHGLIVLDNCEHVVESAASLVRLTAAACPAVRVLATSREPLGVAGEQVYRLEPLDESTGVELFVQCARRADSNLELSDADGPVLAEICRRLDGIPLAIELAAARVPLMPFDVLLARVNERFRLVAADRRTTLPQKHQTLRALIDWSYDLLSDEQKRTFRRLGIFSGGFSLDGACRVAGYDAAPVDVFDWLTALVDKSMVVRSSTQPTRYRMLESIRQYAARRLRESSDADQTRRAHAHYFADLSAEAAERFGSDSEEAWLVRYEPELDNFRAALEWSLRPEPAIAASIVGNLKEFWYHSNHIAEGFARSQVVLAALDPEDEADVLPVLLAVGSLAWRAGDVRHSYQAGERALAIANRLEDPNAIASARYVIGWALFKLGDTERAARELHHAVEYFRTQDRPLRSLLASIDYAIALKRSEPARGYGMLNEALATASKLGWPRATTRIEIALAEYEFLDGDGVRAAERARRVVEGCRTRSSAYALTVSLVNLSSYLSIAGDYDGARAAAREAATIGSAHRHRVAVEWALQSLAVVLASDGNPRLGARLLGHVDAFVDELGSEREPTELLVRACLFEVLQASLDEPVIMEEMLTGRALTVERACALALDATRDGAFDAS